MPEFSTNCPYCSGKMLIRTLRCKECGTEVTSDFVPSKLLDLPIEDQRFIVRFVLASGSLKEMAGVLGVSYPTVRSRLDRLIEALRGEALRPEEKRAAILDAIEEKQLSAKEAVEMLKRATRSEEDSNQK